MESLIAELKSKIVEALHLDHIKATDIQEEAPLFGTGLGLDSIDALELVVMLERDYGIVIQERHIAEKAFASVRALGEFVSSQRKPCSGGAQS
jgi:acyl carrier protein